mgnify:FL=1
MRKILFFIPLFLWTCSTSGNAISETEPIDIAPPTVLFEADIRVGNGATLIKFTNLSKVGLSNATTQNTLGSTWKIVKQPGTFSVPIATYESLDMEHTFEPGIYDIELVMITEGGPGVHTRVGYIAINP